MNMTYVKKEKVSDSFKYIVYERILEKQDSLHLAKNWKFRKEITRKQ